MSIGSLCSELSNIFEPMNWFILIALAIFSALFLYLGFRITGIGNYSWLVATISIGLLLLYPLVWYGILPDRLDKVVRAVVHFDMGFLSIMVIFLIVRDIIFVPLKSIKPQWAATAFSCTIFYIMAVVTVVLLAYGYWNAQQGPKVVTIEVPMKDLPVALQNYSILQITDLHAGAGIDREYVQHVVDVARGTKVDLIALTGDIADGDFSKFKDCLEPLQELPKQSPVLYIMGNHEYIRDDEQWLAYFKKTGFTVLLNEHMVIKKGDASIIFAGVIDPAAKETDPEKGPSIAQSLQGSPTTDVRILLAHQPNIAKEAAAHFDLQLSGHTHAGQFFPWNIAIKVLQPYAYGLKKCSSMWVYTNPGTGYWGPPIRLGTTSEISIIKLKKA